MVFKTLRYKLYDVQTATKTEIIRTNTVLKTVRNPNGANPYSKNCDAACHINCVRIST